MNLFSESGDQLHLVKFGEFRFWSDYVKTRDQITQALNAKIISKIGTDDEKSIQEWKDKNLNFIQKNQLEKYVTLKSKYGGINSYAIPKFCIESIRINNISGLHKCGIYINDAKYFPIAGKNDSITSIQINFDESKHNIKNTDGSMLKNLWNMGMHPYQHMELVIEAKSNSDPILTVDNWIEASMRENQRDHEFDLFFDAELNV